MWIEKYITKQGKTKYRYCERFHIKGKTHKLSVIFNTNTTRDNKRALELLQQKAHAIELEGAKEKVYYFEQVAMEWLEFHAMTVKERTANNLRRSVLQLIAWLPKKIELHSIDAVMIEEILYRLYYVKGLSYSYTKKYLTTIRAIFKYAKRKKYISSIDELEYIELKEKPKTIEEVQKKYNKFLDRNELKAVLTELASIHKRVSLLCEFISLTGLRFGECVALRTCDYERDKKRIHVNGTILHTAKNGDEIQRGTPKNVYSIRYVALNERAIKILDSLILENKKYSLWSISKDYNDRGYIFTTSNGNPYNIQYVNKLLRGLGCTDKHISTHVFRHTHISILAELGAPLKSIMQRVGHNDPSTTLSIYTHVTDTMSHELMEKLDMII